MLFEKPTTFIQHLSSAIAKSVSKHGVKPAMNQPKTVQSPGQSAFVHGLIPLKYHIPIYHLGLAEEVVYSSISGFNGNCICWRPPSTNNSLSRSIEVRLGASKASNQKRVPKRKTCGLKISEGSSIISGRGKLFLEGQQLTQLGRPRTMELKMSQHA